jgi:hypothetical protein
VTGSALHLRSDTHHFVVGGRDHRVSAGTRLDEPAQGYVDAWLWTSDFDELLAMVGRRSTVQVHRSGPAEATRCLLFPNMELAHQTSTWAVGAKQRLWASASQPLVAFDMGADSIRVIDASNDGVIATAPRAHVTATPEPTNAGGGDTARSTRIPRRRPFWSCAFPAPNPCPSDVRSSTVR